jgi:hypothetical protein
MPQIIGAFVFKNDGDGCLTAKWINNDELTPYPEACKSLDEITSIVPFVGLYKSTWIEDSNQVRESDLTITYLPSGVYDLFWRRDNTLIFSGRGMIYNDLLIGSYWDND